MRRRPALQEEVELPGLRSRMLDTTELRFIGVTRRIRRRRRLWRDTASLRQALTRCVCRMEGARAPGIEHRT